MCLGLPCQVDTVRADGRATVRDGERELHVSLLTVDGAVLPDDWVLVHAGFVLERLTEEQARDALAIRSTGPPLPRTDPGLSSRPGGP